MSGPLNPLGGPSTGDQASRKIVIPRGQSPDAGQGVNNQHDILPEVSTMDWATIYQPGVVAFLKVPEIMNIMTQARLGNWSDAEIDLALRNSAYSRAIVGAQPPASPGPGGGGGGGGGGPSAADLALQLATTIAAVHDRALTFGLNLTDEQVTHIAQFGIDNKFSNQQFDDEMLKMIGTDGVNVADTGTITVDREQMKQTAKQYMIDLSDTSADEYAQRIAKGELDINGVTNVFRQQAKARFQYLSPLIDNGLTPGDYFKPTRDIIAKTLEMAPESVDLMDPKWINLVEVNDPATNTKRAATLSEAMNAARRHPQWAKTENAQDLAAAWTTALPKVFGES